MFRTHINLIESITEPMLTHQIAELIANGDHEGFKPYWKLLADERVLSDADAMAHISTQVHDGFCSGTFPHWELKVVEGSESVTPETVEEDIIDEDIEDITHAYMLVPVAETNGRGQGWFEVSAEEAEMWVVEDEHGKPVFHNEDRGVAVSHMEELNSGIAPQDMETYREMELVEDDLDPTDDISTENNEKTRFHDSEDFVVIINAIHERGSRQEEALREMDKRGLWLSPEQKVQAGLE
jgi:hypothetical protein